MTWSVHVDSKKSSRTSSDIPPPDCPIPSHPFQPPWMDRPPLSLTPWNEAWSWDEDTRPHGLDSGCGSDAAPVTGVADVADSASVVAKTVAVSFPRRGFPVHGCTCHECCALALMVLVNWAPWAAGDEAHQEVVALRWPYSRSSTPGDQH